MATFLDDIKIIETAVYGKEMRPAIAEALTQSWDAVGMMTGMVERLNERVDSLINAEPDNPDGPVQPTNGCTIVGSSVILKSGLTTPLIAIGDAAMF